MDIRTDIVSYADFLKQVRQTETSASKASVFTREIPHARSWNLSWLAMKADG
jgi:hypothetical protein